MRDIGIVNTGDYTMSYNKFDLRRSMEELRDFFADLDSESRAYSDFEYNDRYNNYDYMLACDSLKEGGYTDDCMMDSMVAAQYLVLVVLSPDCDLQISGGYYAGVRNRKTGAEIDFDIPKIALQWALTMLLAEIK
jgi:hypothetical protein